MQPFADLGALIESRWRDQNYNEEVFPGIAARGLSEAKLCERVDPWEIISWAQTTPDLPRQMDPEGKFGDPPITLYAGSRFYIDVYYWLDGTTSIHQHSFSGGFQVLFGSSVHTRYRFEKDREINQHFLTGRILPGEVSLLTRGDIREIMPGPQFLHSLFHLERPSATIVIRNFRTFDAGIQYSYLKPFIACDPFFTDPSLNLRTQTVKLLLRMKHPKADELIGNLLDVSDFQTTYTVLKEVFEFLCHRDLEEIVGVSRSHDRFQALLERARVRHGELTDLLLPVFEENWREKEISRRRAQIKHEDHRFFLALLLNVTERKTLLRLVSEKFPNQNAIDLIVEWVRELAATRVFGSKEPNVLGIGHFDDIHVSIFKGLLEGLNVEEIKARTAETETAAGLDSSLDGSVNHIRTIPLFGAIFSPLA